MDGKSGWLVLVALTVALAGCVAPAAESPEALAPAADTAPPAALLPVDQVFEGGWLAGAAYEGPAHFQPSEGLVAPVWKAGFVLEITEVPQDLQLRLDWTGAPGTQMLLMAHAPHGQERPEEKGWSEYTTEFSPQSPLCIRIPPEEIVVGHWYPMTHSLVSADVAFTITVTTLGGAAAILDHDHGHDTNADEVLNIVETETGPKRAWLPCDGA